MNTLSLHDLLLSLPVRGLLWSLLLFAICMFGVHVARLVQLGWAYKTEKEASSEKTSTPPTEKTKEEKKAPAENPQEPIYYIVERKTRKARSTYGEPKQIKFNK